MHPRIRELDMMAASGLKVVFAFFALSVVAAQALAQNPLVGVKPYDGIQAGIDAYRLAEEKRQGAVNQQIFANDQMRFWNGYPTSRGETIYYGYMSPATAASYGYSAYGPWTGFQPGPWMGSGLLGYGAYYQPARQPIGQQQIQMGLNHWESHPVYDPPLIMHSSPSPVVSPLLDGAPYATPATTIPVVPAPVPITPSPAADSEKIPPPPPVMAPAPSTRSREI